MKRVRFALAPLLALALLSPLLASLCQTEEATRACCRQMHNTCMHGEQANSYACCHKTGKVPARAVSIASAEPAPPAPLVIAAVLLSIELPQTFRSFTVATDGEPPPTALYALHASLLI